MNLLTLIPRVTSYSDLSKATGRQKSTLSRAMSSERNCSGVDLMLAMMKSLSDDEKLRTIKRMTKQMGLNAHVLLTNKERQDLDS